MKPRAFDPLHLDVTAFAAQAGELEGQWPLEILPRLYKVRPPEAADLPLEPVDWQAEGEMRQCHGGESQVWLHLAASTCVALQCQRCLHPVRVNVSFERSFRFVRNEAEAEAQDLDSEEEVLAATRSLDLLTLVEDELILELPLVPRHEECPQPLPLTAGSEEGAEEEANPFAQLEVLKRRPPH
ncbi:MAG TPA: YceD family protein [Burkholderiaceae bacterium]|nr:YceD family protein [Burkholderiaceae bacterium]